MRTCDAVIAIRDRPNALRRCWAGLRQQSADRVGDAVADGLAVRLITLDRHRGPAVARNVGVDESVAEIVIFDDDVYPSRHGVEAPVAAVCAPHQASAPRRARITLYGAGAVAPAMAAFSLADELICVDSLSRSRARLEQVSC